MGAKRVLRPHFGFVQVYRRSSAEPASRKGCRATFVRS